ncbi:chaplin [Streptomyces sp. NPDC056121]|uniref:chaplin n=1 Tax=Streptomyces TaxID=1883 RepID=UPI001D09E625|nr:MULTISPECIES: chaplin [Streptomyces]MCX5084587.1 chaplin [Streptomyces sp. NBC_00401]UDM04113.1 chaplin [Streptomyces longhuiensis]
MRIRTLIVTAALGAATVLAGAGVASADTDTDGAAANSPGFLSGNVIQLPIGIPVNACGDSVSVIGLLNPAAGNGCANG